MIFHLSSLFLDLAYFFAFFVNFSVFGGNRMKKAVTDGRRGTHGGVVRNCAAQKDDQDHPPAKRNKKHRHIRVGVF